MSSHQDSSAQPVSISSGYRHSPLTTESHSRTASMVRLGSPVSSQSIQLGTPALAQIPPPAAQSKDHDESKQPCYLPGTDKDIRPIQKSGQSALSAALNRSESPGRVGETSMSTYGTAPLAFPPQPQAQPLILPNNHGVNHQDADPGPSANKEDLEVIKRHLAGPMAMSSSPGRKVLDHPSPDAVTPGFDQEEFSSLRLQGGDVTRPIYRLVEAQDAEANGPARRKSFTHDRPVANDETMNMNSIKQPGGFRRDYIRRTAASPAPSSQAGRLDATDAQHRQQPQILTTSFFEFLSLYGHFAGEELYEDDEDDEDDEDEEPDSRFSSGAYDQDEDDDDQTAPSERAPLLRRQSKRTRRDDVKHGASPKGAALLLLKSFVGTGVLFLPKAFLNGGIAFSTIVLIIVALLGYYCFLLLIAVRNTIPASFGTLGLRLYGKPMKVAINFSLVISQIGFSSAYIVFVAENLQAFFLAVTNCKTEISIRYLILLQMIIFLPLSLYRNITNIQKIAIAADVFILAGLLYLYYFEIFTLVRQHGVADIVWFNRNDWTLFIGTAIFTFEGIGLIIPIQESMQHPKKFPSVLAVVMVIITIVFVSMGALSYAAFGSNIKTVVILNLPQDSKFVSAVQFIYSLAILLSTPLQFFPAIEITSRAIFKRAGSGRNNPTIKWKKNVYRFFMVVICALVAWLGANDLDKFVALVGSFACIPLVQIYPVSNVYRLVRDSMLTDTSVQPMLHLKAGAKTKLHKITDIMLIVLGVITMVYTSILTVQSWLGQTKPKPPGYCSGRTNKGS